MTEEIQDAEIVEPGHELAVSEGVSATLFRTSDPVGVLQQATQIADALAPVIERNNLYSTITPRRGRPRKHVKVEGWQLLGTMLGVFPIGVWTRKVEDGWEARVEARTRSGEVIGAADAMCTRKESRWEDADDHAIRSMAQTRATSKALKGPLGFVVELAGFSATPAEEMDGTDARPGSSSQKDASGGARGGSGLSCPQCGSAIWDNRKDRRGSGPLFRCKKRQQCGWQAFDEDWIPKSKDSETVGKPTVSGSAPGQRREPEPSRSEPEGGDAVSREAQGGSVPSPSSSSSVPTPEALIERFGWEQVKKVARQLVIARQKGETVPVKVEQLADCSDELLAAIEARLEIAG